MDLRRSPRGRINELIALAIVPPICFMPYLFVVTGLEALVIGCSMIWLMMTGLMVVTEIPKYTKDELQEPETWFDMLICVAIVGISMTASIGGLWVLWLFVGQ